MANLAMDRVHGKAEKVVGNYTARIAKEQLVRRTVAGIAGNATDKATRGATNYVAAKAASSCSIM